MYMSVVISVVTSCLDCSADSLCAVYPKSVEQYDVLHALLT